MELRKLIAFNFWLLSVLIAFIAGYQFNNLRTQHPQALQLVDRAYAILEENAIDPLPQDNRLAYGALEGMFQAYQQTQNDPFTAFIKPVEHELQTNTLSGRFGGIGARLERDSENNLLLYPLPDGPAQRAGIQAADQLRYIDSLEVTPETPMDDILAAVRGPVGQPVTLQIWRPTAQTNLTFTIERAEFSLPSVTWNIDSDEPRLGIIQIHTIAETTPAEIQTAITNLQQQGAQAFILDLRNNGGGLLNAGIDTAKLFLPEGIVIQQQFRGKNVESFKVTRPGAFANLPLAILVNGNTASAAELIAGSLQYHHRAILIGQPTYGKGSIQLVFELGDGSSLHVTAARWWVPTRQPLTPGNGLQPDVLIDPQTTEPKAEIRAALPYLLP
ncbi:MAG: hypothetical protein OHK0052_27640 [Anaerolineales bacterium]